MSVISGSRGVAIWVLALVALSINTAITIYNVLELIQNAEQVNHTNKVLLQVRAVLSDVKDAEMGQRGYLLTGDRNYLEPYDQGVVQIDSRIADLRNLIRDSPEQMVALDSIEPDIADKFSELAFSVRMGQLLGVEFGRLLVLSDLGRVRMQTIRDKISTMVERENNLLAERTALTNTKLRTTIWTTAIGGILTLAMTGFAFVSIRRELLYRRQTEEQLRFSTIELKHQMEERAVLQRQTAEFHTLLDNYYENTPIGLAFFDEELRIIRINHQLAEAHDGVTSSLVGNRLDEIADSFLKTAVSDLRHVIATREQVIDRLLHQPGIAGAEGRTWQASLFPILSPDRALLGVGMIAADISLRLRNERELRVSQGRFRSLAESMPQIVWVARSDGAVEYFNQRWSDYTGQTFEASIGSGWLAAVHPEDTERAQQCWGDSVHTGLPYEIEYRFRGRDDQYRWFLGRGLPQRNEEGRIVNWFGTCTDMHERKTRAEAMEELVQDRTRALTESNAALIDEIEVRRIAEKNERTAAEELRRSNQELEQFAYVASHDLQEPLRKIQAFGDRLAQKFTGQLGEQGGEYLDRITKSASRMRTLINDLLTFSRVATRMTPFEDVDLNLLVRDVQIDLEERLSQTQGRIECRTLPVIQADASQMRQLFLNLLANALKFARPGVPPIITVQGKPFIETPVDGPERDMCRIDVSDNGIGFDPQYAERIFQIFQRLHGRNEYEGTGIGLAICRKIVERHAGRITAIGKPGEGATFRIELPSRGIAPGDSHVGFDGTVLPQDPAE